MALYTFAASALMMVAGLGAEAASSTASPGVVETRTVALTQTVTLLDIPNNAEQVRLWVPMPGDTAWQRVLKYEVVSAPGQWTVVPQAEGRGSFVYVELDDPQDTEASVVVKCIVEREGVHFDLENASSVGDVQSEVFAHELNRAAPLMEVDGRVQALADEACGDETDAAKQALALLKKVAEEADHYSKNPNVPTCGRGAAGDCLDHGGGCCTDLHSLFISMARARGIPARMEYGYRLLDGKEGAAYDPGYRCWVEFFVPGHGWVPTDIVAADNAEPSPQRWVSLSSTRVWLWSGRSFELNPPAKAGEIHTMICGWAEIDGKAVDPLPAADGTPSKLGRTVQYELISNTRTPQTVALPQ